jgi:hypothetical protein
MRSFWLVLLSFFLIGLETQGQKTTQSPKPGAPAHAPALPLIDYGACPFEGCTFGKWTVTKSSTLYDSWKPGRKPIGRLTKGEKVMGLTGVDITNKPDHIRVFQAIPELGLKPGDTVLRYMYLGEGYANIWANGKYMKETDCTFVTEKSGGGCLRDCPAVVPIEGDKEWWVKVRQSNGRVGWAKSEGNFDGMDALASRSSSPEENLSHAVRLAGSPGE